MEIDKKIILKLLKTLEELKNSIKDIPTDASFEDEKSLTAEDQITGTAITSPLVGTAYLAPEPGAKKFCEVGKKLKKGDTIMIVEAMKTMNHVPSTSDGIVKKVLVQDGEAVEFGQTLVLLK